MRYVILLYAFFINFGYSLVESSKADAYETIRVAFVDDGFAWKHWEAGTDVKFCDSGHFSMLGEKAFDSDGSHGTISVKAFTDFINPAANYCIIILNASQANSLSFRGVSKAVAHALTLDIKAINLSLEGAMPDLEEEEKLRMLSDKGTHIYVAAGNQSVDLGATCVSFPACYNNIENLFVVGALAAPFTPAKYSNFGERVNLWLPGDTVLKGEDYFGTSFASPRAMALYVNLLHSRAMRAKQ